MSVYSGNAALSGVAQAAYANTGPAILTGGYDVILVSGAGRIKDVMLHTALTSGQAIYFYDAAVAASGGPFVSSGHKIVAVVPAQSFPGLANSAASGSLYPLVQSPQLKFDNPFQSGLAVALKSGQTGFTVFFTPETNYQSGGVQN